MDELPKQPEGSDSTPADAGGGSSSHAEGDQGTGNRDSMDPCQGNALTEQQRWELLHEILVGPEQARIEKLEQTPSAPRAKDVGAVLAEATKRSAQEGPELAEALAPTIEKGLMSSARKNPDDLAEAIYPVLGPAIRRSIQATLAAAIQTLNVTLENSLSPKGIRWRVQAWRTGRPFAEVVLLHSLAYRVEQVYWIHKETSLLLHDVSGVQDSLRDPELVSGMLAAIQDFVQDSFEGVDDGALEQIEVSGFRVLMAQGPKAVLAVLVRGIPPEGLSRDLHGTLEALHRGFHEELQSFDGDVSVFERAAPDLQGLLGQGAKETKSSKKGQWLLAAAAGLALVFVLVGWVEGLGLESRRDAALESLASAPGYTVFKGARAGGDQRWIGFRDPLADPWSEVCEYSPERLSVQVHWNSIISLEPEMVQRRADSVLQPPFGATVTVTAGTLVLAGEAPGDWVRKALALAPGLPGVTRVDAAALVDVDRRSIEQSARSLHGLTLPFGRGSAVLDRGRPVVTARLSALKELDSRVDKYGGGLLRLQLRATLGRSDTFEGGLAARRLTQVQKALGALGLNATVVEVMPAPEASDARSPIAGVRIGVLPSLPRP